MVSAILLYILGAGLWELTIATALTKYTTGKFWWEMRSNKKYSFWINDQGWGIEGKGNPADTISAIFDKLLEVKKPEQKAI